MTKSAALEAARFGVRVNAVAPGPTETGMLTRFTGTAERKAALAKGVPLGRVGDPDEIARAIVFLASDQGIIRDRPGPHRRRRQDAGNHGGLRCTSVNRAEQQRRSHV